MLEIADSVMKDDCIDVDAQGAEIKMERVLSLVFSESVIYLIGSFNTLQRITLFIEANYDNDYLIPNASKI